MVKAYRLIFMQLPMVFDQIVAVGSNFLLSFPQNLLSLAMPAHLACLPLIHFSPILPLHLLSIQCPFFLELIWS